MCPIHMERALPVISAFEDMIKREAVCAPRQEGEIEPVFKVRSSANRYVLQHFNYFHINYIYMHFAVYLTLSNQILITYMC